jgi:hypothetical protein
MTHLGHVLLPQGNRQVTRAAVEFYGPNRAKFLGEFSDGAVPDYLKGECHHAALGSLCFLLRSALVIVNNPRPPGTAFLG